MERDGMKLGWEIGNGMRVICHELGLACMELGECTMRRDLALDSSGVVGDTLRIRNKHIATHTIANAAVTYFLTP